jgi:hypothetical protein
LKTNISVWFDKYFVQPWRLYVHSKRARSWRCKIEARWPVADYKIHTQARLLVGIRPSSASLVRRCTCVYLQQIDGISCVCGYWKGTYAVLNTYGITIEFIDALAVSKSATGETVKIVDVEVYDDRNVMWTALCCHQFLTQHSERTLMGLLVGLLADMNLMDTIVLPTGAKVPLPHRDTISRSVGSNQTKRRSDDHEEPQWLYYLTSGDRCTTVSWRLLYKKCQNILCDIDISDLDLFANSDNYSTVQVPHISFGRRRKGPCVDGVQSLSNSHEIYRTAKKRKNHRSAPSRYV